MLCERNNQTPDFQVADSNYEQLYWESRNDAQRIIKEDGDVIKGIEFMGVPVVRDAYCSANHLYMLNLSDGFEFYTAKGRNFQEISNGNAQQQDVTLKFIGWAGQLCMKIAGLNGVLIA